MACIPAVVAFVAVAAMAVMGLIWASESVDLSSWKLWPKNPDDRLRNRIPLTATVACAKWVRYLWVPGWHVVICRTRLAQKYSDDEDRRHSRVMRAVREAMDAKAERAETF
jgi:hypothetical protein